MHLCHSYSCPFSSLCLQDDYSDFVAMQSDMIKGKSTDISHARFEKLENGKIQEAQEDHSSFVETPSIMTKGKTEGSSQPCLKKAVHDKKEEVASDRLLDVDGTKNDAEQNQRSPELDDFSR